MSVRKEIRELTGERIRGKLLIQSVCVGSRKLNSNDNGITDYNVVCFRSRMKKVCRLFCVQKSLRRQSIFNDRTRSGVVSFRPI